MVGNAALTMEVAKRHGYKTHFVTRNPDNYKKARINPLSISDSFSIIDTSNINRMLQFFSNKKPLGIFTFDDFHVVTSAICSEFCGLKNAPQVRGVLNARCKDLTRKYTSHLNPIDAQVFDLQNFPIESEMRYPCIVKPTDGSGSLGVMLCENLNDFKHAIQNINASKKNLLGYSSGDTFLIEEVIKGEEYSAECVWVKNYGWEILGITNHKKNIK